MTSLIPAYLKTLYRKEPVFAHSKIIYTIGETTFKEKLGAGFIKKALIHASLKDKDLELYKEGTNLALFRGAASYADAITFGAAKIDKKLSEEFSKVKGKKTIPFQPQGDLTDYLQLYNDLASK
jgi:starch synthase